MFGIDLIGSIDGADDDVGFREGVVEGVLDGAEDDVGLDEMEGVDG